MFWPKVLILRSSSDYELNIFLSTGTCWPRREREKLWRTTSRNLLDQIWAGIRTHGRLHRYSLQQEQPRGAEGLREGDWKTVEDLAQQETVWVSDEVWNTISLCIRLKTLSKHEKYLNLFGPKWISIKSISNLISFTGKRFRISWNRRNRTWHRWEESAGYQALIDDVTGQMLEFLMH